MTERILALIEKKYSLRKLDAGEFSSMKVNGMRFSIRTFEAEGLGHVSVMRATGLFGLMKMDTLIVNPTEIDLPLYSYDRIFAMGNDTLIIELYDTVSGEYSEEALLEVKARKEYNEIPERDPGEHWYDSIKLPSSISKKGSKKHLSLMTSLADQHFETYLSSSNTHTKDKSKKLEKNKFYVDGLIKNGGPSTDVFKKAIGEEKTRELFERVLFGV